MLIYIIFVYLLGTITIVPATQYVWVNQTATFTCVTNVTGYSLSFSVSGGVADVSTLMDLPEGGQLATTSFTVTSDNNGTSVRCLADDGTDIQLTTPVFAYAQGILSYYLRYIYCLPRSPIIGNRSYSRTTRVQYIH